MDNYIEINRELWNARAEVHYDSSPYDCFQNTVEVEKGRFQIKGLEKKIPMVYSIVADKKGT